MPEVQYQLKNNRFLAVVINGLKHQNDFCFYILKTGESETRNWERKMKKSGGEILFHYFNMGKSNLVFHSVYDNSWIPEKILFFRKSRSRFKIDSMSINFSYYYLIFISCTIYYIIINISFQSIHPNLFFFLNKFISYHNHSSLNIIIFQFSIFSIPEIDSKFKILDPFPSLPSTFSTIFSFPPVALYHTPANINIVPK